MATGGGAARALLRRNGLLELHRRGHRSTRRFTLNPTVQARSASAAASSRYAPIIGVEVHAQLATAHKLFSGGAVSSVPQPNARVAALDAALPGTLPVLNAACVHAALRVGLALGGTPARTTRFDRKHYHYPDLPQGYQITQHHVPLIRGGQLVLNRLDGASVDGLVVRLQQIQLEQDTAKTFYDVTPDTALLDLNRAGTGLIELVTHPDLRSSADASAFVTKLQGVLRALGASHASLEEGSMRCDVNVSVHRPGEPFGTRCELKNLNSLRSLTLAIEYEIQRHVALLEGGHHVAQETRSFDVASGTTFRLRSKEEARDYRYMPEPDVPELEIPDAVVDALRATLPELPADRIARYVRVYGLKPAAARGLVDQPGASAYFDTVLAALPAPVDNGTVVLAANWIANDLPVNVNPATNTFAMAPVTPAQLASVVAAVRSGTLSGRMAKDMVEAMAAGDARLAAAIAQERGWQQNSDAALLTAVIDRLVTENPEQAAAVRGGRDRVLAWFVGQVMKATKGQGNPALVAELLKKKIDSL